MITRSLSLESCLSGRKDMFAKHAYGKLYQGFESLTLRIALSGCSVARLSRPDWKSGRPQVISMTKKDSGCSVARLSRLLWEQEAAGSNPATPTNKLLHFKF